MKIIVSNKSKTHMEAHKNDFVVDWNMLLRNCDIAGDFDTLDKGFEIFKIDFQVNIGYCNCIETSSGDEIIFAKRTGRDTYSRFVKNRNSELVNSVIFILNKNRNKVGEYYLVTMFPGAESFKEPEDLNIKSRVELEECLDFWQNHALLYDESIIDIKSVKNYCPYKNLYIAIA